MKTILCGDDDQSILQLYYEELTDEGCKVILGLLQIVWVNLSSKYLKNLASKGYCDFSRANILCPSFEYFGALIT